MYKVTKDMKAIAQESGIRIPTNMLGINADTKTVKGVKMGFLTGIMYLSPSALTCPTAANAGCLNDCLYTAGRGGFNNVQAARENKTRLFYELRDIAMVALHDSIRKLVVKAKNKDLIPVVRLNGTSDIDWSSIKLDGKTLFEHYPDVQFYDYTKRPNVARKANDIDNYHVTVSYTSASEFIPVMDKFIAMDNNIAVVFQGVQPDTFLGLEVIDGDESDLRFLDSKKHKSRVVVGLKAKGKARKSEASWLVNTNLIPVVEMA